MHDLRLVGVHDDGEHLVLTGTDGQRFRLRIDDQLRAAVRRDRARLGQLQIEIDGGLRPRDIQARIRAGETAEDVADSAGLPLEHVRRYEGPVLAEREHVADLARRLPAKQVASRPPFGELVEERLTARGVDSAAATWDAWRRDGSTWTVQLAFRAGTKDRRAQWAYDVQRSHLEPLDDEARWLSAPTAGDSGPLSGGRRLAAVSERVYDIEADGGVRPAVSEEPEPQDESGAGDKGAGGARTLDLLDALRGRRGRRQPVLTGAEEEQDADVLLPDELEELPPAAHPPASRPQDAVDAEVLALREPVDATDAEEAEEAEEAEDGALGEAAAAPADGATADDEAMADDAPADEVRADDAAADEPPAGEPPADQAPADEAPTDEGKPARPSRRPKRATVPSWDEIVFGAKKE